MAIAAQFGVDRFLRRATWLDRTGQQFQQVLEGLFERNGRTGIEVRNFLNGVWLGHPLHAALTDVPIGMFTGSAVFDAISFLTGSRKARQAANWCVGMGLLGAGAAALAGMADFSKIEDPQRRDATAHAMLNGLAALAYGVSFARRMQGDWRGSLPFSTAGLASVVAGADIGGHLVYELGTLVSREAWQHPPTEFTPVLASTDLTDGQMRKVKAQGMPILVARVNGQVYAIGDTCTHWGCSLAEGELEDAAVKCHCHGSVFALRDGAVQEGPASESEPFFDVRERDGRIEVKLAENSVP